MNLLKKVLVLIICLAAKQSLTYGQATKTEAEQAYAQRDYYAALKLCQQILSSTPTDTAAQLQLANCYFKLNNITQAIAHYEQIGTGSLSQEALINLALCYQANEEYTIARGLLEKARTMGTAPLLDMYLKSCVWAMRNLENDKIYDVLPSNIKIDGFTLGVQYYNGGIVFSKPSKRKLGPDGKLVKEDLDPAGHRYTNIYAAPQEHGRINSSAMLLSEDLQFPFHEGSVCFTSDSSTLFFTRQELLKHSKKYLRKHKGAKTEMLVYKIYMAQRKGSEWTNFTELPINSNDYDCMNPSLSPDGNTLYFSSNRPGGQGGFDLYSVSKKGKKWKKLASLGTQINTAGNELYPFISPLNILYFSSNGHIGFGGLDVYSATYSNGQWIRPFNLEKSVNSARNDFGFVINPADSLEGFMVSNRQGDGNLDNVFLVRKFPERFEKADYSNVEFVDQNYLLSQFGGNTNYTEQRVILPASIDDMPTAKKGFGDQTADMVNNEPLTRAPKTIRKEGTELTNAFRVQIMSSKEFYFTGAEMFKGIEMDVFRVDDWFKYTTGEFATSQEAEGFKEQIRAEGFADAFVVKYDEEHRYGQKTTDIPGSEPSKRSSPGYKPKSRAPRANARSEHKKPEQPATIKTKEQDLPLTQKVAPALNPNKEVFKVQFMSSDTPLEGINIFDEPVFRYYYKGAYRYTTGSFGNMDDAQKLRKKVIGLGYKDAFVIRFKGDKRVK